MITINKSETADTRSCDFSKVTREQLLSSTYSHQADVCAGLEFFQNMITEAIDNHDNDKVTNINQFHHDFLTGFKETTWWDNHRKINRHHLFQEDGVPADVNLIDVLECITDCVMAGKARTGTVYPLNISSEVLMNAFNNTVELLTNNVEVRNKEKS